ncbi:hypothetical protein [Lysobacter gummosus]|uniref:hypothetical protein n=1 Tax=Lysobacter gummosus TaxID=262324 RepID=UPI00362AEB3A
MGIAGWSVIGQFKGKVHAGAGSRAAAGTRGRRGPPAGKPGPRALNPTGRGPAFADFEPQGDRAMFRSLVLLAGAVLTAGACTPSYARPWSMSR